MRLPIVACSECFHNDGLRTVLARHGHVTGAACPGCSSTSGHELDRKALERAASEFFVTNSIVPETLASAYQLNRMNPLPATLDPTLVADADLLRSMTGLVVFDDGPPLWQLGYTDHYHAFRDGVPADVADEWVATASSVAISPGTPLYRIRKNVEVGPDVIAPATFDPPPEHVMREPGRWDEPGTPVLYVSDDMELCLHECRVALADEIVLATLTATRKLNVLDLSAGLSAQGPTRFQDGGLFADFMSRSRRADWLKICRAVAAAARRAGFDGLRYTSYYSFVMEAETGLNLALFGRPLAANSLALRSVNRVRLTNVSYGFGLGPALYGHAETGSD